MDKRVYDNYILQVLRHGSLTAAARSLGISQPALSNGITHLETELGYRIFNRKDVPITLTEEGKLYCEYVERSRTLNEDLTRRIDSLHAERDSFVRIGGPAAYVQNVISDGISALISEIPDCKVSIKVAPLQELVDMTARGKLDCFISTSDNLPENFSIERVRMEKICLGFPENFDSDALNGKNFILLEEGLPLQDSMDNYLESIGAEPNRIVTVNQISAAVALAKRGIGICFASEEVLRDSGLRVVPLPIPPREIYVAYDRELFMPKACRRLISLLREASVDQ